MTFVPVTDAREILHQFWGYSDFRQPQEAIVKAVLENKDTLALLPTGGGKSLCYQVPALVKGGLCLVISPLTALMQDQVEDLTARGIKAKLITAFMKKKEVDWVMNECVFGKVSFLYVSPERLLNKSFQLHLQKMPVSLIAVDEAHCISQWGHDFRPAYLDIARIREWHPKVPVLALTATATPKVKKEIIDRLLFNNHESIEGNLSRENLAYAVKMTEDKSVQLLKWVKGFKGAIVVYAQSRQRVEEISNWLVLNKVKAKFFHAGLGQSDKKLSTQSWMNNETQVMVATNAFGMGINKPDVQAVIHWEPPVHPEAYFQEAGRAGRGGQKAYGLLMAHPSDESEGYKRIKESYPLRSTIQKVYQFLADGYQLPIGEGQGETFGFSLSELASRAELKSKEVFTALTILQTCGYLQMNESFSTPSILRFLFSHEKLVAFKDNYPQHQNVIEQLLRLYGVSDQHEIKLDESLVARQMKTSEALLKIKLKALADMKVWEYTPQWESPTVTFLLPRVHPNSLNVPVEKLEALKERDIQNWKEVWKYITNNGCRTVWMSAYFGKTAEPCGICDTCVKETRLTNHQSWVNVMLAKEVVTWSDLEKASSPDLKSELLGALRVLIDEGLWMENGVDGWKIIKK